MTIPLQLAQILMQIYVFFIGACVGSFANVCIYRLPHGKSIIQPRSMCPQCGHRIAWHDNVPLLSYLWLRGRCRRCGAPISLRYPLVEAVCGLFALGVYLKFGWTWHALAVYTFIATLIVVTYIDLDHRIIPDIISLPGIPIFLLASLLVPSVTFFEALLGILAGGGSLLMVAWTYQLLTGKQGMGGGDIKLLAMIGAFLGWKGVLFTIFVSSAVGTLAGIAVMIASRQDGKLAVPFGPFLSIGALTYIFFGAPILHWYIGWLR